MPPGTPYHSFALPYPIRVDNFTDTLHDLPPPYNRPPLHLLTHTHSDHLLGLASKSFAYRLICSPDAKEMLLRHEVYAERSLHDHQYRAEKKKTFGHLKVEPYVMPNGQKFFTGSRDLLHAIPLNTPTEFDISDSETVSITLIDANHCPGSVMFLIEGPRGAVLHTGDLRAEPWFLSSIQRNHFLQPYLSSSPEDLRIFVARREGTHTEATGLVKTLEAIYLDTACLLSPTVVPSKERAVQGIVELIALFPSSTYFFINTWTWGYEDILKGISHAFHCKVHLDRYKHSIYSHGSDPFLRALGTRDAVSTRFHACERFDRCSFVDVPPYDYGTKGVIAPFSKEGKKVVYVNAVNMSCARWEDYRANVKRRVLRGENVDSLLVPLSRHSPLPELMNFVTLFRPLRVIPNTLDPSLNGLDWGAMSKMFSGCLSPASTPGSLTSVIAPPCSLTCHPGVANLPVPSIKYDPRTLSASGEGERVDTAYSNLTGPGDIAEQWGEKGGRSAKMEILNAWIGTGRRKDRGKTYRRLDEDADQEMDMADHEPVAGPSRLASPPSMVPRTPKRYAWSDNDTDYSSDEGGSDEHARIAWKLFGVGEPDETCKTWPSPLSQSQSQVRGGVAIDVGTLPTPTSSPLLRERQLVESNKGKGRAIQDSPQCGLPLAVPVKLSLTRTPTEIVRPPATPDPSRLTLSGSSSCTSSFVSFDDIRSSSWSLEGQANEGETNEGVESGSQPFACLDNIILSGPTQDLAAAHPPTHDQSRNQSQSQQAPQHERNLSITKLVDDLPEMVGENMENGNDVRQSKRRRIVREDSGMKAGEKDGVTGGMSSTGLTYIPVAPSVPSRGDKAASQLVTSSAPGARGVSGVFPKVQTVTAAATISFPVRKRIEDRSNLVGKTASLGGPGSGVTPRTTVGKRLVPGAESISAHTNTSTVASNVSTDISGALVSPRIVARRAQRAERERITEKLRRARPDLAVLTQASSGQRNGSRILEPVATEDANMDLEKSRQLAERVREAVKRGEHVGEVLPRLNCLEQWYAERTR